MFRFTNYEWFSYLCRFTSRIGALTFVGSLRVSGALSRLGSFLQDGALSGNDSLDGSVL